MVLNISIENVLFTDPNHHFNWSIVLLPLLVLLYSIVFFKLCKKNREKMEPIHILEFANFIAMVIWGLFNVFGLGMFQKFLKPWSPVCFIMNFIGLVARFSIHITISLCQVERFLFLYWSLTYKGNSR